MAKSILKGVRIPNELNDRIIAIENHYKNFKFDLAGIARKAIEEEIKKQEQQIKEKLWKHFYMYTHLLLN